MISPTAPSFEIVGELDHVGLALFGVTFLGHLLVCPRPLNLKPVLFKDFDSASHVAELIAAFDAGHLSLQVVASEGLHDRLQQNYRFNDSELAN